jgi:hypothetical protein
MKHAIAQARLNLKMENPGHDKMEFAPEDKWIFDAGIKGFFDEINYDWLLNNLRLAPELLHFVKKWLKKCVVADETFNAMSEGTTQVGILSPTLVNFILNGLESTVLRSIYPLARSEECRYVVKLTNLDKTCSATAVAVIRYVADFIITARTKYTFETWIIPAVKQFLADRGLILSSKTKLFCLSDKGAQLNFLGYTFKYRCKWRYNRYVLYSPHTISRGIAVYPIKEQVQVHIRDLKHIYRMSSNETAYTLITKLNPIIRWWSAYYNVGNSSHYRGKVRNALYHLTWRWAHRKHRRWGKRKIADTYFLRNIIPKDERVKKNQGLFSKTKRIKWVFSGITRTLSRYTARNTKRIFLNDPSNITPILSTVACQMPEELIKIHAYSDDYMKLARWSTAVNMKKRREYTRQLTKKWLKRQNVVC